MKTRAALLLGGLLAAAAARAQGDFPFDRIPGLDAEPTVEIDLSPELMSFFNSAARGAGDDVASAFEGVTHMRLRVYEDIADAFDDVAKFVDDTTQRLEREGWHSVVRVNEDDERVRIYMKPGTNGKLSGLTLMITEPDEAVFINVAGDIEPARLGQVAAAVGVDGKFDLVPGLE